MEKCDFHGVRQISPEALLPSAHNPEPYLVISAALNKRTKCAGTHFVPATGTKFQLQQGMTRQMSQKQSARLSRYESRMRDTHAYSACPLRCAAPFI